MRLFISSLILLVLNAAAIAQHCVSGRYGEQVIFAAEEIEVIPNISFAEVENTFTGATQTLNLDVWMPSAEVDPLTSRPVIFLVHGGSFLAGNRAEMNGMCLGFAQRGYVAVTLSYRLGWGCDPNAGIFLCAACGPLQGQLRTAVYNAVQDAHAAVRFILSDAASYGIDPNAVFIGGTSAGAITALGTAFLDQAEANAFAPVAETLSGPLFTSGNDIVYTPTFRGVINNCGALPSVAVINDALPVISFHDDGDCVVPYGSGRVLNCLGCAAFPLVVGSQIIHNTLAAQGVCTELNTQQLSLLHCSWPSGNIVNRASCFLKRTLCDVCTSSTNNANNLSSPCMNLGNDQDSVESCTGDLNGDQTINVADLIIMLSVFGTTCN
jgi:poly(3-hydroxybutyrate) depolymerase